MGAMLSNVAYRPSKAFQPTNTGFPAGRYLVSERLLAKRREVCPFDEATAILAILAKALVAFVRSFNSWALCALAGLLDAQRTTPPRQRTAPPVHPFALAAAIWLHILLPDTVMLLLPIVA